MFKRTPADAPPITDTVEPVVAVAELCRTPLGVRRGGCALELAPTAR